MDEMEILEAEHKKVTTFKKKEALVKLQEPITWGSERITEIHLKQPRGKHLKYIPANAAPKDMLVLASKVSGVSIAVFDELCWEDVMAVAEAMGELL